MESRFTINEIDLALIIVTNRWPENCIGIEQVTFPEVTLKVTSTDTEVTETRSLLMYGKTWGDYCQRKKKLDLSFVSYTARVGNWGAKFALIFPSEEDAILYRLSITTNQSTSIVKRVTIGPDKE